MSELRGNSDSECPSNCNCSKKVTVLQRRLKKYKTEAKYQKLWTKYVTEWLLYKFAFDVNLRIKLSKEKGDVPDSDSEDEEEDDEQEKGKEDNVKEMEQENIQHCHSNPTPNVQVNKNTSNTTSQQGSVQSKAKKRKIEESTVKISKSQPDKPEKFTVLSLGTKVPIKAEVSSTLNRNNNYNSNSDNNEGNFQENYDNSNENLESTRSSMTVTTTTSLPRVQIVHEEDPDIDIKYDPFAELNAQNDDEFELDEEDDDDDKEQNEKDPFAELGDERNQNHLSVAKTLTPFEQQINEMEGVWKTSTFNFQWILDMKRYQTGIMPCTMFIKRDDVRQWFEYLPNKEKPELSRFRCRICCRYVREFGYPVKYHGPVEANEGQLKKSETDNRNAINLHSLKQSHKEIILRLTNAMKKSGSSQNELGLEVVLELPKQKRKQLLDTLEAS